MLYTTLPDPAEPLDFDTAYAGFATMLDGVPSDGEIQYFLTEMTEREETATEIAAAATAMRERLIPINAPEGAIDVCGTGGDGHLTLNVSTAVAIAVAAAGVPVAKHGNRAASSRSGAADTLEWIGLDMTRAGAEAEASLAELGICFLFAANHHPAMKRITPIRKRIGRRTIFNLMGPLSNPARVRRQLIGIARPSYVPIYAEALDRLGADGAMIASGEEALDEISVAGPSRLGCIGDVDAGERVVPEDAGLGRHPVTAIRGGDPDINGAALLRLLGGDAGAYRDAVLLNSAAALIVAGRTADWAEGAAIAAESIDSGAAKALLERWIDFH
ncbi:MAG: anthranilate phosphoribosyltransferase [Sphingomonadaceae bacterium]|nr:anthranilate phosphoribosyltransferase [Sphingomonadaceae bacterium]